MRRASLADWLCRLSAAASWPRARAATALAGVSGGTTIRGPVAAIFRVEFPPHQVDGLERPLQHVVHGATQDRGSLRRCGGAR